MRLRAEQLANRLQRSGLDPVYILSGDEPLQILECADLIRACARDNGVEERLVFDTGNQFDWNTLAGEAAAVSLFSSKRLLELRLVNGKPGKEGGKILVEYAENHSADDILLITTSRLDKQAQNTKWFRTLEAIGVSIQVWPVEPGQLPAWIRDRCKQHGKNIAPEAAGFIADRVEGNLLAARQEIEKLALLVQGNNIDLQAVMAMVADTSRYDVFKLIESALARDTGRTIRMLQGLRSEGAEPIAIYGALLWEFRRLCSMAFLLSEGSSLEKLFKTFRIWDKKRQAALQSTLRNSSMTSLHHLLRRAVYLDRQIKSADRQTAWDGMQLLLLAMAGADILPAEPI